KGTVFTIYLPLAPAGKLPIKTGILPRVTIHGRGCILLADDEQIIRITAKALLEDLGYEVITAANGEEALQLYQANHDRINLVILDMVMPKMNGTDCFRALRAFDPKVKVIISSGFTGNEIISELKKDGLAGFIHKPFMSDDISTTINKLIQSSSSSSDEREES
ncbi:MAG: response regulator, partial [Victivallales bacterium]|nr:response regulator [Victivallales bacterium]